MSSKANKARSVIPNRALPAMASVIPQKLVNEIVHLFNAGQWQGLLAQAQVATQHCPRQPLGWQAKGKALLKLGRMAEAKDALAKLIKLVPADGDAHNDHALACQGMGQLKEAENSFRKALSLKPDSIEACGNLGLLLNAQGRLAEAVQLHQRAVELQPQSAIAHNNLGIVLRELGRYTDALARFEQATNLGPHYLDAHVNLGLANEDLQRLPEACEAYIKALAIQPNSELALLCLGKLLTLVGGREQEAMACLNKALVLNPNNVDALVALGNLLLKTGPADRCEECFRRAQALRPLTSWLAREEERQPFSVVILDTPRAGSTPVDYLMGHTSYDRHFFCVLPQGMKPDQAVRAKADVLINIIADADNGSKILPEALAIADALDVPTINHPRLIMQTDRASIARRLQHIPLCRVPHTDRIKKHDLLAAASNGQLSGFELPLLVRLTGVHGGDAFAKCESWDELRAFVQAQSEEDFYVTEFADYQSHDGAYRKYRFICIDGEVWPYHLAIHDDWMVHHFRTDMASQAWKRQEEEAFLRATGQVFDAPRQEALRQIAATIGLDYCGIDCALDANGQIVIFEVNATMLVHDEKNETFAYKNPYIARIKEAFNAMVIRFAGKGRQQRPAQAASPLAA